MLNLVLIDFLNRTLFFGLCRTRCPNRSPLPVRLMSRGFVKKPEWRGTEYGQVADTGAVATGKLVGYTRVLMSNFVIVMKLDME